MLISDWSSDVCSSDLYDRAFSGRCTIDEMFAGQGLSPDIVLEAIDADVVKTYVDIGMGVGIIAGVAFDPRRDKGLVGIPVDRTSVVEGRGVAVRVDLGGCLLLKKKKTKRITEH